ncbi:MAG TPA: glycosyl transferase [Acholeplasmataceae bacterium]|nr:glycosyl transferase [Acholeplasmataceae bacterium]
MDVIDFVIPWVDGNDPEWISEFNKYAPETKRIDIDIQQTRYRDNGLLKYVFRGIEQHAPWVNKIHFVTCGQKPLWMNIESPKINFVNHSDYIPEQFLPVFNSHPIELFLHKIPGLSEKFVYFNDDSYLTKTISSDFFFKKNKVNEVVAFSALPVGNIEHIRLNNILAINKKFSKSEYIKNNWSALFSIRNGKQLIRTIPLAILFRNFTGFFDHHFQSAFLKSSYELAWDLFYEELSCTMNSKFRSDIDVNQYLIRYLQYLTGIVKPFNLEKYCKFFKITDDLNIITNTIKSKKYVEISINDYPVDDYDYRISEIQKAFEEILPKKSSFEL